MCFSATASFASSGVIAVIGVATLARTRHAKEWLFAAVPLLFAIHQFNEGMVWLGLKEQLTFGSLAGWGFAYMLFAQALLPLLMPLGIWLIEPNQRRGRRILPFLFLGAGLAIYIFWALLNYDTHISLRGHSVVYNNPETRSILVAILYIVATCGALFFSGYRPIVVFGALNVLGLVVVLLVKQYAFTSVWCAYAAITSLLIYGHFYRRRMAEVAENAMR